MKHTETQFHAEGLPQGLVLGPLLFSLYNRTGFMASFICNVNDTQLFFSFIHQTSFSEDICHSVIYIPGLQPIIQILNLTKLIDLCNIPFFCDECDNTENTNTLFLLLWPANVWISQDPTMHSKELPDNAFPMYIEPFSQILLPWMGYTITSEYRTHKYTA